jgi:hypothetical protein
MDKCLVTKLGASVSGNFPKLGELIIDISTVGITPLSSDAMYFVGADMELRGDIEFSDDSTDGADASNHAKYLKPNQTGQLVFKNKYGLTKFSIPTTSTAVKFVNEVDIKELAYNSDLSYLICGTGNKLKGDIACLADKKLTTARLDGNVHLEGDIVAFAATFHNAVVNNLTITNFSLMGDTEITGSIEELVQAIRALGSTASNAQQSFNVSATGATFNGSPISAASGLKLSWTTNPNTITYNGVTINA